MIAPLSATLICRRRAPGLPGAWPVLTLVFVAEKFPGLRVGAYMFTNNLHNAVVMKTRRQLTCRAAVPGPA